MGVRLNCWRCRRARARRGPRAGAVDGLSVGDMQRVQLMLAPVAVSDFGAGRAGEAR